MTVQTNGILGIADYRQRRHRHVAINRQSGDKTFDSFEGVKQKALPRARSASRLFDEISARPAAQRAHGLKVKLALKTEFDEETRRNLFPQNQA